jgi:hypothetical protein
VNVGDSRAFVSRSHGTEIDVCSTDHKPQMKTEMDRIFKAGASLYRVSANSELNRNEVFYADSYEDFLQVEDIEKTESHFRQFGPWRVKPGGLSVSLNISM